VPWLSAGSGRLDDPHLMSAARAWLQQSAFRRYGVVLLPPLTIPQVVAIGWVLNGIG
jgi:hypothetical protein